MTDARRTLVLGLDGYEPSVGERLMAEGRLPHLARLREESLRFELDHGEEKYSGLTWEHLSAGASPRRTGRWSAVHLDTQTYDVMQMPTELPPFLGRLPGRSVVFDCPYFDLDRAPGVRGLVGWGAHDAGVPTRGRPEGLLEEVQQRFGAFVGGESLYAFTWPSRRRTEAVGRNLVEAAAQRAAVARWLLAEGLPDWDLALVVTGELHSASEPLWHGIDPAHPLHGVESAEASARALVAVYDAVDRLVGDLTTAFPDAAVLAFAMHGMGPNESDVPSMALLPELLFRWRFGRPMLEPRPSWRSEPIALLGEDEAHWDLAVRRQLRPPRAPLAPLLDALRRRPTPAIPAERRARSLPVDWIPAAQYRRFWPSMRAFALPAYYHGRIRLNLQGREARGKVRPRDYDAVREEVARLLRECTDPRTGLPAVQRVERFTDRDPLAMDETDADLDVLWNGNPTALDHPRLGRIGPVPHRRTGGHTGAHGIAYLRLPGHPPADGGKRSAFDVAPTLFDLRGETPPPDLSGRSLLDGLG